MKNVNSLSQDNRPQTSHWFKKLRQQEVIQLSAEDSRIFLATLENPPPLNDRLKAAIEEHQRRVISLD